MLIPADGYAAIFRLKDNKKTWRPIHAWNEDGHPMYVTETGLKDATEEPSFLHIRELLDDGFAKKPSPYGFGFVRDDWENKPF